MTAFISLLFSTLAILVYLMIKGAIIYFGKKSAEHVYENSKKKGLKFWRKN